MTIFEPRNFRTAIQYRLGIPVVDFDSTCPMCTQPIDIFGDHAVCCTKAGDLIVRHNNLRNLVDSIASDGLEPRGVEACLAPPGRRWRCDHPDLVRVLLLMWP